MIGFGMLGRAELAFVVIDIAYVQNNVFTTEVFYTLMVVAFWLNLAVPLTIRFWRDLITTVTKALTGLPNSARYCSFTLP